MLKKVKDFFGVGIVKVTSNPNVLVYLVENLKDCLKLREHFLNYPLLSYK
jgi:LAGLIDADG endonuclease